jgi:hypothetical protein
VLICADVAGDATRLAFLQSMESQLRESCRATTLQMLAADVDRFGTLYPLGNGLLLRSENVAVHIIFHPHKIVRLTPVPNGNDVVELVDIGPKPVFEVCCISPIPPPPPHTHTTITNTSTAVSHERWVICNVKFIVC